MIEDFLYVHKNAWRNTRKNFKLIPVLAVLIFFYVILFNLAAGLISGLLNNISYMGGFALAIIRALLFSQIIYNLDGIVNYNRFYFKHLKEGFTRYLSPSITIFFIYWMVEIVLGFAFSSAGNSPIGFEIINLIIFLVFSGMIESVYIEGAYSYDSLLASLKLLVDEPLNWTIFNILVYLILDQVGIRLNILKPSLSLSLMMLINCLAMAFFMVYKGHLYKELYMSNRRKREYMR